jgi:hypothetical protein
MAYVRTGLSGLGIDPVTAIAVGRIGYSGLKRIFGTRPPEKPFPWRWDRPGREVGFTGFPNPKPGYFGIVYCGSKHDGAGFHRVWEGSVWECFDRPGFDISGTIDGGKRAWRAYVKGGKLQVVEDFGRGWVPVFASTRQQLIDWTHHVAHGVVGPITRPAAPGVVPASPAIEPAIVAAGFAPDLGGATMPLLIAAGVALMFILKR